MVRLAKAGQSQLAQCEEVIERGLDSFIEVGNALLQIREGRLYKDDYDNFEDYCRERWDMCGRRAHQLIDSAKVIQNIGTEPGFSPTSERQTRALTILPASKQREVWTAAVESSPKGKPTAKQVVATIARMGLGKIHVGLTGKIHNPIVLKQLKALWKEASETDKAEFKKWIT